jgi:hypothetical protein
MQMLLDVTDLDIRPVDLVNNPDKRYRLAHNDRKEQNKQDTERGPRPPRHLSQRWTFLRWNSVTAVDTKSGRTRLVRIPTTSIHM